ncbi:hypothetical protein ACW6AV_003426 [Edwardsiella piscicida]|uniref:hypothetical protein n=1 Tax=Edwardsiella TaxID=635 RepID=UPI000900658D|nr:MULTISPECIES: hypothetical protein [Edwardsiella]KAB0589166.1 hypothetical protein F7P84_15415 [Edwardsiella anguillarum]NJS89723.1 hypothetical protein [Escherichia coli]QBB14562.1 hypothetical protein EVK84_18575 [Edwardsiella piscicida]
MKRLIVALGALILTGCASEQQKDMGPNPADLTKPNRVTRELSQSWDNIGRGGAALRQPAYVHVLGNGNVGSTMNNAQVQTGGMLRKNTGNNGLFNSMSEGKGYSLYELSRWERYCDNGKGMDEHDWRFIKAQGETNIPRNALTGCIPPSHSYNDYLTAWTHFCTKKPISDAERSIVRNSVRPFSVVNPCKALK